MDFVVGSYLIGSLRKIESYSSVCSDHYPVAFEVIMKVARVNKPWRITKTLLQSHTLAETAELYYDVAPRQIYEELEKVEIEEGGRENQSVVATFEEMERGIKLPWVIQANRRRLQAPSHWNRKVHEVISKEKAVIRSDEIECEQGQHPGVQENIQGDSTK